MATDARDFDSSHGPETEERLEGNYFVATYPPFSCWRSEDVAEAFRVLETPQELIESAPLCLYVHVPFCVERCDFCYYRSYAGDSRTQREQYVDALLREAAIYGSMPALSTRDVDVVYFGGGTPSLLSAEQITRLMRGLQEIFPWQKVQEVTFECSPKTVTQRRLLALREAGVTRISLGIQQLDDDVLKQNGRIHLVRDVERAFGEIRRSGFETVNVDLMVGLVGESDATFFESLRRVMEMEPDSVTLYLMEIPPNTPLYQSLTSGDIEPPASWDVKRERLAEAFVRLEQAGFTVRTAYAALRDPDLHRFHYQEEQYRGADLLGLGVSSFSYVAGAHYQNVSSLSKYLNSLSSDQPPVWRARVLEDEERLVREFVLQLKLGGLDAKVFQAKFNVDVNRRFAEPLARLASQGYVESHGDHIEMTRQGLLRVDHLIPEFYLLAHRDRSYW